MRRASDPRDQRVVEELVVSLAAHHHGSHVAAVIAVDRHHREAVIAAIGGQGDLIAHRQPALVRQRFGHQQTAAVTKIGTHRSARLAEKLHARSRPSGRSIAINSVGTPFAGTVTMRLLPTWATPGSARNRFSKPGGKGLSARAPTVEGAETYTSARSVPASHCSTALRKLPTITPTPVVTDRARVRAAVATPVRLSPAAILRAASLPVAPRSAPRMTALPRAASSTAPGTSPAQPTSNASNAPSATVKAASGTGQHRQRGGHQEQGAQHQPPRLRPGLPLDS